jgi:hypothetical protein
VHKFNFTIGSGDKQHVVCKSGFIKAYTLSRWYVDDVISRYKAGHKTGISDLNEKTSIPPHIVSDKTLTSFAEEFGITLTPEHLGNLRMADGIQSKLTVSWMSYYFSLVGDHVPNSNNEIHLEPIPRSDVYKEYCFDMAQVGDGSGALSLDAFRDIWKNVFPHVRIRKYKSSCGHCNLCSILSEKRRKFRDKKGRQEITNLFSLHRLSTMGERRTYYDRRMAAQLNPSMFLSTIADGMQQNHCMLPWFGNNKQPPKHVKQHLQGVYMHGDNMTIYRTYANVGGGANLAIHTWLLSLEDYSRRNNHKLPRVLYHQIDGGPENANVEFLAVCSLLVACGIFDKIVLTRLPVGHTHEDIDALFALIWKRLRDEHIYTPSEFAKMVCECLKKKVNVNVVDVFAVPDYVALFRGCVDEAVARFAKEEWAQLQFTFERVPLSDDHPLGVKTTYRSYVQDSFIEIVETDDVDSAVSGLIPQECIVRTRPLPDEAPLNILLKLPFGDICPAPFIAGSREIVDGVAQRMISHYRKSKADVAEEWQLWSMDFAPLSDNVQDYLTGACGVVPTASVGQEFKLEERGEGEGGVYIPFKRLMFSASAMSEVDVDPRQRGTRELFRPVVTTGIRVVESTSCVLHNGNNNATARRIPSRVVVQETNGDSPAEPKTALNGVYPGRDEKREAARERTAEAKQRKDAEKAEAKQRKDAEKAEAKRQKAEEKAESKRRRDEEKAEAKRRRDEEKAEAKRRRDEEKIAQQVQSLQVVTQLGSVVTTAADDVVDTADEMMVVDEAEESVASVPVPNSKRKATGTGSTVETVVVTTEWKDTGAVDPSNVVSGKRMRKAPASKS